MNPLEPTEANPPAIKRVVVTEHQLILDLEDGRSICAPLDWYPTLRLATQAERQNYEIIHSSVHWPDLDCDLSSDLLLRGAKEDPRWAQQAYERHFALLRKKTAVGRSPGRKSARPSVPHQPVAA
jgi:hypothetical protein